MAVVGAEGRLVYSTPWCAEGRLVISAPSCEEGRLCVLSLGEPYPVRECLLGRTIVVY